MIKMDKCSQFLSVFMPFQVSVKVSMSRITSLKYRTDKKYLGDSGISEAFQDTRTVKLRCIYTDDE